MKFNTHAVPAAGLELAGEISPQELGIGDGEFQPDGPCHFSIRIRKLDTGFHVRGTAWAAVVQTCSRCLVETPQTVEADFTLVFEPASVNHANIEEDMRKQDLGMFFFEGNEIDLAPEVLQALRLALPSKPLCSDGCKGLCATCGADLNVGPCACKPEQDESHDGTLGDLMKKWSVDRRAH